MYSFFFFLYVHVVIVVVVGHRCLLFSYMYEYACATHITMKTMFRLIDDLCQVKAALIFMANHSRYVPRNFTIDFAFRIFPFYPSNTLFVAHVILMLAFGIVVVVVVATADFFSSSLGCCCFRCSCACLYERFIYHYSSYEANKKNQIWSSLFKK